MPNRIRRITIIPVRVPIPVEKVNCPEFPHEMLHRGAPGRDWGGDQFFGDVPFAVVKVEGDGGPAGWSDSSRYGTPEQTAAYARCFLGCPLETLDPRKPNLGQSVPATQPAHKEVETAVLDWVARVREAPLHTLFGEKVRDRVRVEYWSGHRTPAGAGKVASEGKRRGFLGLKLKASMELDVGGVTEAVFKAAGPDFHLNIDPNGRWKTVEDSVPRAKAMLRASPNVLLEDPIYNTALVAEVRRQTGIPMARTVGSSASALEALRLDAADVYNIGSQWDQMLEVAAILENARKPFWLGSAVETGLMDLASAHFAATQAFCTVGSDLIASMFREDDFLAEPVLYEKGHLVLPKGPGRGIATDEDAVERFRLRDPLVIE